VAPIPSSTQFAITEFARDAAEEGPANYSAWIHSMTLTRQAAGRLLSCEPEDVCFVKSTNHGILIAANSINWKPGDNVVGLAHEFPANMVPWRNLAERGVEFRVVPERDGHTHALDDIAARMDARTRLLAVSWVEYSTGVRNDIRALSALARERGAMFLLDAIQGLGVLPVDLAALQVDFLAADGHKWLLAPEGCGLLYVRRGLIPELNTSMCGWCGLRNPQDYDDFGQEYKPTAKRFEEGSHNLMAITALGASLRLLLAADIGRVAARVESLATWLMAAARAKGYRVVTPENPELRAGIVSLTKEGVDPKAVAAELQEKHKIMVAARRGFIRVSPHFYNDEEELQRLVDLLP
jgi:selenocysteine lyase/cysteine desulfurase